MSTIAAKVLLTRPAEQSKDLAAMLTERGLQPIICPVIEIVRLTDGEELRNAWSQWRASREPGLAALTSARTVEFLVDARVEIDLPCAAVGPRTKQAVQGAGWQGVSMNAKDAVSMARELVEAGYGGKDVWLPSSRKAGTELEDALRAEGSRVTRVDVYEPRAVSEQLLRIAEGDRAFDVIVFHSSSAVDAAVDAVGAERLADARVVCVGESTASGARKRGLRVGSVAQRPTDEAVLDAIASTVASRSSIIGAI
jgi:uroporphyrinogen-III synthase